MAEAICYRRLHRQVTGCSRDSDVQAASAPLEPHALDDVGNGLAAVYCLLERLEDVLPADHHHRVGSALEERGEGLPGDAVTLVLEPVDLDELGRDVLAGAHAHERLGDRLS